MNRKLTAVLEHPLTAAFTKSVVMLGCIFLGIYVFHLLLSLMFFGPRSFGVLFGALVAVSTFYNYRTDYPKFSARVVVRPTEETPDEGA